MGTPRSPLSLLLLGATGAVGQQVLALALADARVGRVTAPTRRPLPAQARLVNPVVDFQNIDTHAPWWQADAVVCALGTTIKVAGSQQAFAAIDRDLVIATAQWARQAGATRLALNSSLGASRKGNFYLRTKAEAEDGVRALGYPSLTIVRPSLIEAERDVARPGEVAGLWVARALGPLVPRRYRPVTAQRIARALLEGVLQGLPGEHLRESEQL
ncbi:MAG: NAD(P)H-binding protein [Burkholderiaceae bacterium]|nr:NAD(P)H-binding protein [Burkholderiaceae bacterium]